MTARPIEQSTHAAKKNDRKLTPLAGVVNVHLPQAFRKRFDEPIIRRRWTY